MSTVCKELEASIGSLFSCSQVNGMTRIRTPFTYPDGDVIDVFIQGQSDALELTDLGETMRWLRMQTPVSKRSLKQRRLIEDACLTHGVEFFKGELVTRISDARDMADAVSRICQACLRVSDLWFTFRLRAAGDLTEDVADFLQESDIDFDQNVKTPGKSGRMWPINFQTRTPETTSFVLVLTTGAKGAARRVVEHVTAAWYDLSHLTKKREPVKLVSLFDDTLDVWAPEDFSLLEELSDVRYWSKPAEFIEAIHSKAA